MNFLFSILIVIGIINSSTSTPIQSLIQPPVQSLIQHPLILSPIQPPVQSHIQQPLILSPIQQPLILSPIQLPIQSLTRSLISFNSENKLDNILSLPQSELVLTDSNLISNILKTKSSSTSSIINVVDVCNTYPIVGQVYFLVEDVIVNKRNGITKNYAITDKIKFIGEYTGSRGGSYNFINDGVEKSIPYDYKKSPFFVNLPLLGKEKSIVELMRSPEVGKQYFHAYVEISDKSANNWRDWKDYTSVDKLEDVGEYTGIEYFNRDSGGHNFLKDGNKKFVWGSDEAINGFIEYTLFDQGLSIIEEHPELYEHQTIVDLKEFLG